MQDSGQRKHQRPASRADGALRLAGVAARVVAALTSALLVVYIGYLWNTVRGLNNNVTRLQIPSIAGRTFDARTGKTTTRYDIDGKDQNILIAGNDDRSSLTLKQARELKVGLDGGSLNTDTMMIVHVPADGSQATLVSLPRDSYVDIPGYGMNKLNAAYPLGYTNAGGGANAKRAAGANLLIRVIEKLTGLNIDHFVEISLLGFVDISDAVGGVPVDLCHSVDDTVAHNASIGLTGGSGLVLSKGEHTIKGVQALEFVRQREGLVGGDVARTARQRYFITAAFRKIASAGTLLNIGKLQNLVSAVEKSIYVDQGLNMLSLAKQMSNLSANNIRGEVIPTDGYQDVTINGYRSNVGIINPTQIKAFVHKVIAPPTSPAYVQAKTVAPDAVSVSVRKSGLQNGGAAAAAGTLDKAGFHAKAGKAVRPQTTTTIEYRAGSEAQAKTLARYVPGAAVTQANVSGVTLVLGSDGIAAKSTPSNASHKTRTEKSRAAVDSRCIN